MHCMGGSRRGASAKRFLAVVRDAQGDARGGGEAGEMRAIPIPSSYCYPECCL